jgi:uncharacterized membrane protein
MLTMAQTGKAPETLVGISFTDSFRAQEFLTAAGGMSARDGFHLKDAVVVKKDDSGHTAVLETTDLQPSRTAMSGAMWAGLIGLFLGGPVLWAAGAAIGASAGAITAKLVDVGIRDEWVDWFRKAGAPGSTIVAILVTDLDRDALVKEVTRFSGAHLVYANLDDATLNRLHEALGEPPMQEPMADASAADAAPNDLG